MTKTTKAYNMQVHVIYDNPTFTLTYIVYDHVTKDAVIIDPVLDYDSGTSTISFNNINIYKDFISKNNLKLHWILETHAHADHLTGAAKLKEIYPAAKTGIGSNITEVQKTFKEIFNNKDMKTDGSQFDQLIAEGERLNAGSITITTHFTPGHTPACVTYEIENHLFTGDTIFHHDYGTGRCDFPQGSAEQLYHSIKNKIFKYPDDTLIHPGHDYPPSSRDVCSETTVELEKKFNPQLKDDTTKEEFINFRTERDKKLKAPRLLLQSIQFNIVAGMMQPEDDGNIYLKLPLKT